MPIVTVQLETPLVRSFRAEQVAGLFDLPLAERWTHTLTAEVPSWSEPWTIGAIVGPSGSGKTTLARAAFGEIYQPPSWPDGLPLIECLDRSPSLRDGCPPRSGGLQGPSIKHLARLLTAVGLGSVHAWLKPYRVLSTGERFRADVARAVQEASGRRRVGPASPRAQTHAAHTLSPRGSAAAAALTHPTPLVVFDEFTSSLDRTIAKTASAALSRYLRRGGSPRLVALTCHDDILPWLAPDWVVELGGMQPRLTRGGWPPLEIPLRALRVPQSLWREFAAQHYLAGGLAPRRRATRRH